METIISYLPDILFGTFIAFIAIKIVITLKKLETADKRYSDSRRAGQPLDASMIPKDSIILNGEIVRKKDLEKY